MKELLAGCGYVVGKTHMRHVHEQTQDAATRHHSPLNIPYPSSHDLIMGSMPFRFSLRLVSFGCDAEDLCTWMGSGMDAMIKSWHDGVCG